MKKVLVTGAKGMLGQDLCPILSDSGYDVVETDIHNLDITNFEMTEKVLLEENPVKNEPLNTFRCQFL